MPKPIGGNNMKRTVLTAVAVLSLLTAQAFAADKVKLGLITTLSGPQAVLGIPMRDAAELALDMLGRKIGGLPAEIVYGDDQQKPDLGRQEATKMLEKDKVDFITGMLSSAVLLAVYQEVIKSGTIMVSGNAGPHQVAGEMCSPYFFNVAFQSASEAQAMGLYLTAHHVDNVYAMAPNYAAGHDMIDGFKRGFKGKIVDEVYTALNQADYQVEITQLRAANPSAVFAFFPGSMGIQFIRQYAESGVKDKIPLYTTNTVDSNNLRSLQDAAVGIYDASYWGNNVDIPRSREFVAAFQKKYDYTPAFYAAGTFDAIFLIDSAVKAVGGNLADKKGLIRAMEKADFPSVRGAFKFNSNHFPIEDMYVFHVIKENNNYDLKLDERVVKQQKDLYYTECHMKAD